MMDDPLAFGGFEIDNIGRVSLTIAFHLNRFEVAVAAGELIFSESFVVWFSQRHLRIVGGTRLVKNANVFVLSQRLQLGIEKIGWLGFNPNDFVFEKLRVRDHQVGGEKTLSCQSNDSAIFDNPFVVRPKLIQRNDTVPMILGCPVSYGTTQNH